jgi:hypothetical protein
MSPLKLWRAARALAWGVMSLAALGANLCQAQVVGEVEFSRGVGVLQSPGRAPQILGQGLALHEGDRLTTADSAFSIVRLQDGTQMTLRPNTELVLQRYRFQADAPDNQMVLRLLRGGVRTISGSMAKSSPDAAQLQTRWGDLQIRGTDFDARLCGSDCKAQVVGNGQVPRPNPMRASAKVALVDGPLAALEPGGQRRNLVKGASIYPGETVQTGAATTALLAFRDESRMTVGPATRFRLDNFVFDKNNQAEGQFFGSLLRGSLRALTGLIGRANQRNVSYSAPTATIGIRGTGLDLDCPDELRCSFFTWLGTISVTPLAPLEPQDLPAGQGLSVSATELRALGQPTLERLLRPDSVDIDFDELFAEEDVMPDEEGLYLFVRDGHIEASGSRKKLHLGRGETGFVSFSGNAIRPRLVPLFLDFDPTPMPNSRIPALRNLLQELGVRDVQQCK